jgi:tetratricopeptide (TPR) repeat protein
MADLRALMPHMGLLRDDGPYRCFFLITNGLLEYRDGNFAEAIELLREVKSDRFSQAGARRDVILAMSFYQRGELQTAKTALDRAHDAIPSVWPKGQGWEWLYDRLLLQEAEKLIAGTTGPVEAK